MLQITLTVCVHSVHTRFLRDDDQDEAPNLHTCTAPYTTTQIPLPLYTLAPSFVSQTPICIKEKSPRRESTTRYIAFFLPFFFSQYVSPFLMHSHTQTQNTHTVLLKYISVFRNKWLYANQCVFMDTKEPWQNVLISLYPCGFSSFFPFILAKLMFPIIDFTSSRDSFMQAQQTIAVQSVNVGVTQTSPLS